MLNVVEYFLSIGLKNINNIGMQFYIIPISIIITTLLSGGFFYLKDKKRTSEIEARNEEVHRKMYELTILKEVGDRISYSLNIEKIADVIIGSLNQFIEYSTASYMLIEQGEVVFKLDLEKSVSKKFVADVKTRMMESLTALLSVDVASMSIEETITGALAVEDEEIKTVKSYFNIPLVIHDKVVGVLTIAHTEKGLYKEAEMNLLYKIVNQASLAVARLEEVIETEQQKLDAMVESMAEGVVMTDNDFRILVINPAAKNILGLENKETMSVFDIMSALSGKYDFRGKLEESIKFDKIISVDDVLLNEGHFQVLASPVKRSDGGKSVTLGGVVLFHDITHEKETERMREDFTSMIVHELRTPLDGIKKMGEFLQTDEDTINNKEKSLEYIGMIRESSSGMLDLVNDLLDVAKLESGKFQVSKASSNIIELLDEKLKFFDTIARDAKIELIKTLDIEITKKADIDQRRIEQVVSNLLSNAIKFTNSGGKVYVQTFLHKAGGDILSEGKKSGVVWHIEKQVREFANSPDAICVVVTDNGIGIPKEKQSQLFNKFQQFSSSMRDGVKGSGLGLVISKGIIEAHGGLIGVASIEDEGTSVYFTIPIS